MKFSQWYKKRCNEIFSPNSNIFHPTFKDGCKNGWDACKHEILEILKKDKLAYHEAINSGTIEKIQNL